MLCDTGDGGNRIRVYDMESGSERVLDGAVPCSEIVLDPIACPGISGRIKTVCRPGFFSGLVSSCTNFAYFYTPKPNRLCR